MTMDAFAVQNIWVSVLVQVARDLTRGPQRQSGHTAMAERWIGTYPTRDFRDVCTLAGLEPSASHAWFRRLCDASFEDRRTLVQGLEYMPEVPTCRAARRVIASEPGRAT